MIGEIGQVGPFRGSGENENGAETQVGGTADIGFHGVADHGDLVGCQAHSLASSPHHEWIRFANVVGLFPGGGFEQGDDGPAAWTGPLVGGAPGIGVGGDEAGPGSDAPVGKLTHFVGQGPAFAYDDEVRMAAGDGVLHIVRARAGARPPR